VLAGCQTISGATDDSSHHFSCLQPVLLSRPFCRSRDQDRDLGLQVSRLRPRPGQNELECTRVSRPWSRNHNTGCIDCNDKSTPLKMLQITVIVLQALVASMLSWDQDWDLGLQVSRPRPRPWPSGLETETWTKWTRVHSSLETMVSRSQHCLQHALCLLSAWNRFLLTVALQFSVHDCNICAMCELLQYGTTGCKITACHSEVNTNGLRLIRPRRDV